MTGDDERALYGTDAPQVAPLSFCRYLRRREGSAQLVFNSVSSNQVVDLTVNHLQLGPASGVSELRETFRCRLLDRLDA
ncbi:hypothetical protein ACNQR9_00235 [Mycolicibacterium peregrinum]